MRSRRDQLQAYQFLRHRIVSALLSGEPESVESPMRRIVRTTFAGLMVAVIALAVFGIIGLIKQGGANSWRDGDTIVQEKGTGALYVWQKGKLYPMLNYTSARLQLGSAEQSSVSRKSLEGIPREPARGIQGAPGSPPAADDLIRDPWTVCARTVNRQPKVTLLVGTPAPPAPLGPGSGVVVSGGQGEAYLVWKGRALHVTSSPVLAALGFSPDSLQPVGAAFVNALEHGPDLSFPNVAGRGGQGPALAGRATKIGQVFVVKGVGTPRYFVMLAGGLSPVNEGIAKLLLGDPANRATPGALDIGADVASGATQAPRFDVPGYPDRSLTGAGGGDKPVLCLTISGTTGKLTRSMHTLTDLRSDTQQEVLAGAAGETPAADYVYVQPGHGALARQGNSRTVFLIVDGRKFPLGDDGAGEALGYEKARVSVLPEFFLSLLPTGPSLSRQAAGQPATPRAAAAPAPSPPR